jgi:RNA polymerase sigma factor (sigma-70 family)
MTPANDNTPRPSWFDALLAKYDGFIRSKCRTYPEPDDLYQAVMLRALSRWASYRPQGNFVAWIGYQIRSEADQPRRLEKRRKEWPYYAPARAAAATQEYTVDLRVLDGLPAADREVITLLAIGFDGGEVGKLKGISRQRVFQIASRGRALLAANDNQQTRLAA